jgi:hypothetical protein
MTAITATENPGHIWDWMTKKRSQRALPIPTTLSKQLKRAIWQKDEDGKTPFSLLE